MSPYREPPPPSASPSRWQRLRCRLGVHVFGGAWRPWRWGVFRTCLYCDAWEAHVTRLPVGRVTLDGAHPRGPNCCGTKNCPCAVCEATGS